MNSPTIDSPAKRQRFGLRLEAIRDASRLRDAARATERSEEQMRKSACMVRALDYLEEVELAIRAVLDHLGGELPSPPTLSRSTFDGRYQIAVRLDEPLTDRDGRKGRYFTRLSFLLEPRAEDNRFVIEVRSTVRERDQAGDRLEIDMTAEGLDELKVFAEARALAFAESYFSDTELSRGAGEPSDSGPALTS